MKKAENLIQEVSEMTFPMKRDISQKKGMDQVLSKITEQFLNPGGYKNNVDSVIKIIGEYSHADRIGIYFYKEDYNYLENENNWFKEKAEKKNYTSNITYSSDVFNGIHEVINIGNMDKDSSKIYRNIPYIQKTKSILIIPIKCLDKIEGFMEIDSIKERKCWSKYEISCFNICCNILTIAYMWYKAERGLLVSNNALKDTEEKLKGVNSQLMQNEKMSSIGYLAAGVAHEINNPLGFVSSNFETLIKYANTIKKTTEEYKDILLETEECKDLMLKIKQIDENENLNFIFDDLESLFDDTKEGIKRISTIVKGLRDFSHKANQDNFEEYDLNLGIKDTLIISKNEIKYSAKIEQYLQDVPIIQAIPGNINQVILNLIINASQAIKTKEKSELGLIRISTWADECYVYCEIEDNGVGIAKENIGKIFSPFYTTKPVGIGTGLGLSISYDIIKNVHHGEITLESELNVGTKFILKLPIKN